ncbi:Tim44/TimA family putative adaptor protein [Oleisolibacter albus]|uniref:Tim44/TimA family putative adaptor protein n=1 Tax=Oleisolibacter albus TaxID=2171757 RepID=UPI000DF3FB39|nr:Tim44/TimA family putative adaptor protein [Oleisolibacter albus]
MGEGFFFIDILIFAMVAAFLVFRLRSVLGRRHGEERQRPNPFAQQPPRPGMPQPVGDSDNVVPMPGRTPVEPPPPPPSDGPVSLEDAIRQIRAADPGFNERQFLQGARGAFEMIVQAFAAGDTPTLRPLLADDVYDQFALAIRQRQQARETLESRIHSVESVDLTAARMEGRTAFCTVTFISHQTHVTRDAAGTIVDGDESRPEEVVDIWTFARNTRATDPNWKLVETRTP